MRRGPLTLHPPEKTVTVALPPEGTWPFEGARLVVDELRAAGHEAFVVGGAARDLVLGQTPKDWDIATSATPGEVLAVFPRAITVGVQFGVVRVVRKGFQYEIATFRAEMGYSDGRRPDSVRFTDIHEDVLRRDFTINGLFVDLAAGTVHDLVGGIDDLQTGVIRAIGDPRARFEDDHLRTLRAVRFAAQLGFTIEDDTLAAVRATCGAIATISAERINDEMGKLLASGRPGRGLLLLRDSGLLGVILPELGGGDIGLTAAVLDRLAGHDATVMWTALLQDLGVAGAGEVLARLRHSNQSRGAVRGAITTADALLRFDTIDVVSQKRTLRSPFSRDALAVLEAKLAGACPTSLVLARSRLSEWTEADLFPPRLVTGIDAMEAGIAPGPAMARVLAAVEDAQLRGDVRTREEAVALLGRIFCDHVPP